MSGAGINSVDRTRGEFFAKQAFSVRKPEFRATPNRREWKTGPTALDAPLIAPARILQSLPSQRHVATHHFPIFPPPKGLLCHKVEESKKAKAACTRQRSSAIHLGIERWAHNRQENKSWVRTSGEGSSSPKSKARSSWRSRVRLQEIPGPSAWLIPLRRAPSGNKLDHSR